MTSSPVGGIAGTIIVHLTGTNWALNRRIQNTREQAPFVTRAQKPHQEFRGEALLRVCPRVLDRVMGGKMEPDQEKMKGELARLGGCEVAERGLKTPVWRGLRIGGAVLCGER